MKTVKITLLSIIFFGLSNSWSVVNAQLFCKSSGNIAIFSNYDGGILRINVDQNIPNLKIGIVSYEDDSVIISGTYMANVTEVVYAGYFNSSNIHCTPNIDVKGVYGVSPSLVTINFIPAATINNPYGYSGIICNTACSDSTYQGGCNTSDQIADYFTTEFAASNSEIYFHYTQYGCWSGTYNISGGGNCCKPLVDNVNDQIYSDKYFSVYPNPSTGKFSISTKVDNCEVSIYNAIGEKVYFSKHGKSMSNDIDFSSSKGIYFLSLNNGVNSYYKKIVIQ